MILKSIGVKNPNAYVNLMAYITRDTAVLKENNTPYLITHNVFGNKEQIIDQLRANEEGRVHPRRSNTNLLLHTIISLAEVDADKVSPDMLERLVREFMAYSPDVLHVAALHMARNPHAHIISSGCDMNGLANRVDRETFQRKKQDLQELFPELKAVEHGKHADVPRSRGEYTMEQAGKISRKEELRQNVSALFELSTSKEEFFALLKEEGYETYMRGGEVKGIEADRNYRFSTLDIDLHELDLRSNRLQELAAIGEMKEPERTIEKSTAELSLEQQRLNELEELEGREQEE